MNFYALNEDGSTRKADLAEFALQMELSHRRVALSRAPCGMEVSTVFLVLDHQHFGDGPPVLFETMVFYHSEWGYMKRYCTRDEARAGHENICALMREDFKARPLGYSQAKWRSSFRKRWL